MKIYKEKEFSLYCGDCLEVMKTFPDNSVDSIVTDPPYGINFMNKKWDYNVPTVEVWEECLRILKPGGHLLSFAGTRTQHRMAVNIEDAGFEIKNLLGWIFGSGFPKSRKISKDIDRMAGVEREIIGVKPGHEDFVGRKTLSSINGFSKGTFSVSDGFSRPWMKDKEKVELYHMEIASTTDEAKKWDGWETGLKPAFKPITLARKPITEKTIAENVLKYGCSGFNIGECRVPLNGDYKCKANGRPSQTGLGDNYDPDKANQPDTVGRFPANIIHDGSEEVLNIFPITKSGAMKRKVGAYKGKSTTNFLRGESGPQNQHGDSGSAARFFYCAKASKQDRDEGLDDFDEKPSYMVENGSNSSGVQNKKRYERKTVNKNNHPTVKPLLLMQYLCRLITQKGGVVLDPYMGSGSTGKAAILEDFNFIGIEKEKEYFNISYARIQYALKMSNKPKIKPLF